MTLRYVVAVGNGEWISQLASWGENVMSSLPGLTVVGRPAAVCFGTSAEMD